MLNICERNENRILNHYGPHQGIGVSRREKINLLTTCSSNIAVICIGPSILSDQETGMGGSWNSQNFKVSLGGMVCILEGKDARGGLNSKLC